MTLTTFDQILSENRFHTFLVDASGVLYSDGEGVIPQAIEAWKRMQRQGSLFLVTNNTCQSPDQIIAKLTAMGMPITRDRIISSGLGLSLDPKIRSLLVGKQVYWVGYPEAQVYLEGSGFCGCVDDFALADVVVIASSIGIESGAFFDGLYDQLRARPIPVICCNPDQCVRGVGNERVPVAGFYAQWLWDTLCEDFPEYPFYWIGKPFSNFSGVVQEVLSIYGITPSSRVCFFDDNPRNVSVLAADLGIQGCWVWETGIGFGLPLESFEGFKISKLGV